MVQEGINEWAHTVISMGQNIKIAKSYAKVSIPVWNQGHFKMKNLADYQLNPSRFLNETTPSRQSKYWSTK